MGCRPSTPKSAAAASPEPSIEELDDDETSKSRMYRPSTDDPQPPDPQDDLSSEAPSEESAGPDPQEKEHLCQTEVTLQWLVQVIGDRFDKTFEEEPRWIVERLNRPKMDELANTTIMRVTFGWEDRALPKNVIVKTIPSKDLRDDEESKFALTKFKRRREGLLDMNYKRPVFS
ncbi:unnamed protein product [Cylicocyclus nassatus]|uniref:Uncharacterized protein n=1 Tax=Cylicocyclus nassatus TaxID=53992 RepID=A0AA36M8K5_CYLNA|nr:unnamed protein product [Cylicocyclus nassatus]